MSRATERASARVPMSCGWSKSNAPAQMRVTATEYSAAELPGAAPPAVAASAAAAKAVATMPVNARMGRMMGRCRSIGAPSALNHVLEALSPLCDPVHTLTQVTFRILGPLEALVDGRRVDLPSRRERALLGVLLLQFGEVVSVDTLVDSVWGEQAPASARHLVHEYVSRLRGVLGDASVIVTRAPGYIVERDACDSDAARFAELLNTARSAVAAELERR